MNGLMGLSILLRYPLSNRKSSLSAPDKTDAKDEQHSKVYARQRSLLAPDKHLEELPLIRGVQERVAQPLVFDAAADC